MSSYIGKVRSLPKEQRTEALLNAYFKDYFTYHFRFYESMLNPYLRNLTVLLKMLERFKRDAEEESDYYILIIRTNLSEAELFLLYHLALFELQPELRNAAQSFELFDTLAETDRAEFQVASEKVN